MANIHLIKRLYTDDKFADTLQQYMLKHSALIKQFNSAITFEHRQQIIRDIEQLRFERETFIAGINA